MKIIFKIRKILNEKKVLVISRIIQIPLWKEPSELTPGREPENQ